MMTFTHLMEIFLKEHGMSAATQETYRKKITKVMGLIGARRDVATLTVASFDLALKTLETQRSHMQGGKLGRRIFKPYSAFTLHSQFRACRAMFNWAVVEGKIERSPMLKFKFPKLPPVKPKAVSADTFDALVTAAEGYEHLKHWHSGLTWVAVRDVAMLYLLRDTGARCGGLTNATLNDLDLKRGRLSVTEKGNKTRFVYLSPVTIEKVKAWLAVRARVVGKHGSPALLISVQGHGKFSQAAIGQRLSQIAARAGIKERHNPHSFRHAFARDLLNAGADLSRVSQLMGHASMAVTADYYARWADRELQAAHTAYSPLAQRPTDGQ